MKTLYISIFNGKDWDISDPAGHGVTKRFQAKVGRSSREEKRAQNKEPPLCRLPRPASSRGEGFGVRGDSPAKLLSIDEPVPPHPDRISRCDIAEATFSVFFS